MRAVLLSTVFALSATAALAADATVAEIKLPDLPMGQVTYPGGKTLTLNRGIGSAAFRDPKDPPGVVWTITDRGPNLDCEGIEELTGLGMDVLCAGDGKAKNFPQPDFTITIQKVETGADNVAAVTETISLKTRSGKPVGGLPFSAEGFRTEAAYDVNGKLLAGTVNGFDTETLARLPDGSFLIGEEYGPSLIEVAADGTVTRRHVPAGLEGALKNDEVEVVGSLPAIMAKRYLNRGIENVAVSPDGATIYVLMQSPLANPDSDAYKKSANTRLWKIDRATGKLLGEFVYVMDDATSFRADNKKEAQKQNAVRMSEMVFLGPDKLLVLERIGKTSKFHAVDLAAASPLDASWDDAAMLPSLEQLSAADLAAKGITPVAKTLLLDSDDVEGMPKKVEGVAVMSPTEMIVFNDSDFGIEGDGNRALRVTFKEPVLQ
ncbi:esterase-like activity of phytase family protein [Aestuariivirga litoralis]|uniref:Esterase-like activity of phytase family protein n=1 Tax=Aestuariivirga litoralis TaxID=2650924 RepID=A0A2W2CFL0_9HYPH|nr:esterase-like activity of phytase family protein [Aestuariivirga litoralis]PZF78913.1 esterase-like activity of phytase family protein [Aestuariivirga litoralis]